MNDSNQYVDMSGLNANRRFGGKKSRRSLDELRARIGQSLDEWTIDPAEPVDEDREPCRECGSLEHEWEECKDYDPSPVNSWEVTEGTSAAERDELAWRQKGDLEC